MAAQIPPVGMSQGAPSSEERSGLTKVMWYGVIGIVGLVGGWFVSFLVFGALSVSSTNLNVPPNASSSQVAAALTPIFHDLSLLIPSIIAIGLVGDVLLTMGFRDLSKVDDSKFSLPWKFMVVLIIGALVAAGSIILLFNGIPDIIAQAPSGSGTPSAAFFTAVSGILFAALCAAIGGIMVTAGTIGGKILGLWRVGSKYNSSIVKVGAIFVIIPLLNYLAPILILIGAYQVRGRLSKPM